ncbi:MAG: hypothetical protein KDA89_01810, partial [Planctomycetaceae bacterium]|nr:hypothetical protein [Planctomycetaceae bacterium]
ELSFQSVDDMCVLHARIINDPPIFLLYQFGNLFADESLAAFLEPTGRTVNRVDLSLPLLRQ